MSELGDAFDQVQGARTEGELDALLGAEKISDEWPLGVLDGGEQKRRSSRSDHAPVDFRDLLVGTNGRRDFDEFAFAAEGGEELAQVGRCRRVFHGTRILRSRMRVGMATRQNVVLARRGFPSSSRRIQA